MDLEYRIRVEGCPTGRWMAVHGPDDLDGYDLAALAALGATGVSRVSLKVEDAGGLFTIQYRRRKK